MEQIQSELRKILASPVFAGSDRMSRFLRFTVEHARRGEGDHLKEYLLGVEVFDRKSSYDPRIDPIVRVEARRLRSKLEKYYETDGRDDPVRIDLPKGSYAPVFRERGHAAPAPERRTIAVLPFANLTSDPENEYFSDGLTEELIHALTKVEGLRVVAWSSAFQFKDKARDIRQVGRQLSVDTVLEGSVRRAGDRLRITAQLVDVSDGRYLWSQVYEREVKDVFAIQDEISRAIVNTLRLELADALVKPSTRDLEAYHLYLRGRFHSNKRTGEGLRRGIEYFDQAIAVDPRYALAYSGLADCYSLLSQYGLAPPSEAMVKAKETAMRALEIDDTLAEAHTSVAYVSSLYDWEWSRGEQHYRRALELNPGYAQAHHFYGIDLLAHLGRFEEAREHVEQAQRLDPLSLVISTSLAFLFMLQRDYDRAIEENLRVLELDPNFFRAHMGLGRAYLQKKMYPEAIDAFRKGQALSGGALYTAGPLGECYALSGREEAARRLLAQMLELSERTYVPATTIALIYAGLNETETALDWLERACRQRDTPVAHLKVHPAYDRLRSHPRFPALLRTVALAA